MSERKRETAAIAPGDREWTDAKLYKRYGLKEEKIAFIESTVQPMAANATMY